jgi:ThiF family/Prokaryotic homologs of the JAB domain
MSTGVILRMTGKQKAAVYEHLFPADGREAVALALCGRRDSGGRHCLSVCKIERIPYEECDRGPDSITWPTARLIPLLQEAARHRMALVKLHSHPGGYDQFSEYDDTSDKEFFAAAESWTESVQPHGSVIALPGGRMFGRTQTRSGRFRPIELISVAGDSIEYWFDQPAELPPEFTNRHAQVLGDATIAILRRLRAAVVGCSGTGSPTVEQLFRLGIGELILVDPDVVGIENLNRILNSRDLDVQRSRPKVHVLEQAIHDTGLGTVVSALPQDLCVPQVIKQIATCDVIFGCVDSVFARHVLNKLASTYSIPYFDIGVGLKADGNGGISHVSGAINYLQPDGSSLLSRGAFSLNDVQADALRRSDPNEYADRLASGYIAGAAVARPAVITVNMIFSGLGVFEFLNRLHGMRDEPNARFAMQRISLSHNLSDVSEDGARCWVGSRYLGQGDLQPLLGMPELSEDAEVEHGANA